MANRIPTREAYGKALAELGGRNDKIVVFDADVAMATKTIYFKNAYPNRFFDAGISEANMICTAAGMADMGYIPFVSSFAVFGLGRAFDQVRNTAAYGKCNVKLCMPMALMQKEFPARFWNSWETKHNSSPSLKAYI